jgi:hypothetical protein
VRQITYFFAKAQSNAVVVVFDDFLLKAIAGCYPRLIVAIGDVPQARLVAIGLLPRLPFLRRLLFQRSLLRDLLLQKQALSLGTLLGGDSQLF